MTALVTGLITGIRQQMLFITGLRENDEFTISQPICTANQYGVYYRSF